MSAPLTPRQEELVLAKRDKWIRILSGTEQADRPTAENAIREAPMCPACVSRCIATAPG